MGHIAQNKSKGDDPMKLKDVIKGLEILSATADREQEITGVSYDSRTTAPGDVFVAISGATASSPWQRKRARPA